ncbi:predicted protein [Brucella sp. 83/13]|nr:predicted protein [Brucella sp. 83/13]
MRGIVPKIPLRTHDCCIARHIARNDGARRYNLEFFACLFRAIGRILSCAYDKP